MSVQKWFGAFAIAAVVGVSANGAEVAAQPGAVAATGVTEPNGSASSNVAPKPVVSGDATQPSSPATSDATAASPAVAPQAGKPGSPTFDEILNGTAPPTDYSQLQKCLRSELIERTEPLSDRFIVFHMRGGALWIAQMRNRCPEMTYDSKLMFEKSNPRICEWDSVRVVHDEGLDYRYGPRCNLPKFEPVSPQQVDMLKQALTSRPPKVSQ